MPAVTDRNVQQYFTRFAKLYKELKNAPHGSSFLITLEQIQSNTAAILFREVLRKLLIDPSFPLIWSEGVCYDDLVKIKDKYKVNGDFIGGQHIRIYNNPAIFHQYAGVFSYKHGLKSMQKTCESPSPLIPLPKEIVGAAHPIVEYKDNSTVAHYLEGGEFVADYDEEVFLAMLKLKQKGIFKGPISFKGTTLAAVSHIPIPSPLILMEDRGRITLIG